MISVIAGPAGVAALLYLAACAYWPWARCWCPTCQGGKHFSPWGGSWRLCKRCRGTGRRLRIGRRVADWARNHRQT